MPATENVWRNPRTMHIVFALSSLAMLGVTIWMMVADYDDEWRDIQRINYKLTARQLEQDEKDIKTAAWEKEEAALQARVSEEEQKVKDHKAEIDPIEREVAAKEGAFASAQQKVRFERAKRDKTRADLDLQVRDGSPASAQKKYQQEFNKQQAIVDDLELKLLTQQAELNAARAKLAAQMKGLDEAQAALKKHETNFDRVNKSLTKIEPPAGTLADYKRRFMELPIIEGFNGPLRLNQLWLPELTQNYGGMRDVPRFDRCITCHVNIDAIKAGNAPKFPYDPHGLPEDAAHANARKNPSGQAAPEMPHDEKHGYQHPYSTHPNPDLYLTDSSPHKMQRFGCTICHEGQGSGTSFQNSSHSANGPAEAHRWHEEYKWAHNHFWEYPMLPKRLAESSCIKCHHDVVELGNDPKFGASAPKVFEGYELIRKYGCFGCHEINGYSGGKSIGPDMRLEPQTEEEAARIAADPTAVAGTMRKVGPGLRHFASKTTKDWTQYWIENPQRFRPETRMPRFFGLVNQQDHLAKKFQPVEIATMTSYLFEKSVPLQLDHWEKDYKPNAERGKLLFSQKGCMACHQHDDFPGLKADFGPNLTNVHSKLQGGDKGIDWLYTWIRDPQRHSPRSKMPNLFLNPEGSGDARVDPAADIAAWLVEKGPGKYEGLKWEKSALHEMALMYLSKTLNPEVAKQTLADRRYPIPKADVKGDEIELADGPIDEKALIQYVGRRSISRYGCYGCHDIPGFDKARPIGTALQDWGRKDSSKLALEHIEEFLHHHGQPDGSSTAELVATIDRVAIHDEFKSPEEKKVDNSIAYFYEQLMTHGRAGFLWQKLRSPRSYDYKKISTKGYDERLRMPKFPFDQMQIEAIATFVLGLVAEPPAEKFLYRPTGAAKSRIEGEKLLTKYNCTACHMLEMPEIKYGAGPDSLTAAELGPDTYQEGLDLLLKLKPPRPAWTKDKLKTGEQVLSFHGLLFQKPDPQEDVADQEFSYDLWETLEIGEKKYVLPGTRILVPAAMKVSEKPARGGMFAEWLVDQLMKLSPDNNRFLSWQMSPPPLYQEGIKVQTPWLFNFLRNPYKIRNTTVLRMPRFNMSDLEAQQLANYFSAVDGSTYPYQVIPERDPAYLDPLLKKDSHYLQDSWKLLNAPLCIKCHSLGGRQYQAGDPKKDIQGPNLDGVPERLRSEWTLLWLFKPAWITPYTSMPQPFPKNQKQFPELFHGDGLQQTIAVRDALMNYYRLLEKEGKIAGDVTGGPAPKPGAGGGQ